MIEPERFHVFNDFYPMYKSYGAFCAREANAMQKNPPASLLNCWEQMGPAIHDFYKEIKPNNSKVDDFGKFRPMEVPNGTPMVDKFGHVLAFTMEDWRNLDITHKIPEWADVADQKEITLTSLPYEQGGVRMEHFYSPNEKETFNAEHLWNAASQAYVTALDPEKDNAERRKAALSCYWLCSHYMPYERGSATAARIMLEFMAESIGFDTGRTKRNVDLNIEALTRKQDDFLQKFDNFFSREPLSKLHSFLLKG